MPSLSVSCLVTCEEAPLTQTVFPRVEKRLATCSDLLRQIPMGEHSYEEFQSFMDWFYVRVFPHEWESCYFYYYCGGDSLRDLKTRKQLRLEEKIMLRFLDVVEQLAKAGALAHFASLVTTE